MYSTAAQMDALGRREGLSFGLTTTLTNRFFTDDKPITAQELGDRPVMLCEFAHAMGNSLGNFAEYLEVFHAHRNQLGGFIWDFADQSIRRTGPDGRARWHYGGTFGETPNHRHFCNNGILGPDRAEHPSAREVFWGYRPLVVEAVEARAGRFALVNRFGFLDASGFDPVLEVRRDGALVATHRLAPVSVEPGARVAWDVPQVARAAAEDRPGELVVRFDFRHRDDSAWAQAGSTLAFDEFVVTALPDPAALPQHAAAEGQAAASPATAAGRIAAVGRSMAGGIALAGRAAELAGRPGRVAGRGLGSLGAGLLQLSATGLPMAELGGPSDQRLSPGSPATLRLDEDPDGWRVRTQRSTIRVQRATGHLVSWVVDGQEVLAAPIRPNYWRALTDNDRGYGNIDQRLQHVLVDPAWRDVVPGVVAAQAEVARHWVGMALAVASPLFGSGLLRYEVAEDGSVEVHHELVPVREMYRIGLTLRLPDVQRVRWYGKGPHENYIDRNRGAITAVHELPIGHLPHHYVRPQENGNRTEVRWLEAVGPATVVRVDDVTGQRLGFTAWPWTQEHLDAVEDDHDLVAGPEVTLNVDRRQRGVGGDLPGVAALLPEYTIRAGQRHAVTARFSVRSPD
jgi:hypothetical protein